MQKLILTIGLLLSGSLLAETKIDHVYKLVLPYGFYPMSYDPLDADLVNNSDITKMRYLTPIEIDHADKFKSTILESFAYDDQSNTMKWVVRKGLHYADGTEITP